MKRQKGYGDEETSPANLENEMETLVFRLGEKVTFNSLLFFFKDNISNKIKYMFEIFLN
jgi:hypothetical protein